MTEKRKSTEIQEIANSCIERWGEDSKTKNFSLKLGRFVSQLGSNVTLGKVLLDLIKHYNYYSREHIDQILIAFYQFVVSELKLDESYTIYSRIEDDSKIDSSNSFLEEFKILNDISNHFSYDIEKLDLIDFDQIKNVIFLDDIIGSGKTVERFFNMNKEKLLKVNCYIFCIELLIDGKEYLENYFKENGFECEIFYHNIHLKAFSDKHIFGEHYKINEELLREFERGLWKRDSNNILGFENSQAIVSFFRNTPNNTLSSFWFKNNKWEGLFPRNDKKPAFKKVKKNAAKYNVSKMEKLAGG
ncbi:hypothetical protein IMZ08_14130 [Bacillus luteolus]|uniref:PRTase-CE domain-containing protein n=1 Tax=Litchfieldia luteola TaxID=682179 RepID=A0ABR9QL24_9BACI|nr:hypothetical protein [Cytobacillus luteolus]MBE4909201.1 hypothetical protein [Cytobacillus luteolus]MBP1940346.1 hypothetical protein [Cytobacillus luteolus]